VKRLNGIKPGDLVKGGTLHNFNLIGLVMEYRPNHKEEFLVHWFGAQPKGSEGYMPLDVKWIIEERFYDLEKIS
jgi:hypothetical protein